MKNDTYGEPVIFKKNHITARVYSPILTDEEQKRRMELVKQGTADLTNVTVLPTGPYLLSAATFPTYFLKDREAAGQIQCALDIEIFTKRYAPHFGITDRGRKRKVLR